MKGSVTVMGQQILLPMIRQVYPKLVAQQILGVQPMSGEFKIFKQKYTPQSKYKFSRAKWYVAEFDTQYYSEVEVWCAEQFGPHPRRPDAWSRWHHTYEDKIHFRDERDYQWFVLRWGA